MSLKNLNATKIPKNLSLKLSNKKIKRLFNTFEKNIKIKQAFIVAVSGGPDSLALAFFTKVYSIKYNLRCRYFIVDHKLRKESTKEAKKVKKILSNFDIKAEILTWNGKKPSKNIQSLARKKRYDLLFSKCKKLKISNLIIGHHLDDLFENFFIRILRGSGLKGIISLDKKTKNDNKFLLRPLLDQKKEDLIFISDKIFNFYVQDPSNNDEKYQRIRIRKLIANLQKDGLDKEKFYKTILNFKNSNDVINFYIVENLKKNTFFFKQKNKLILNQNFFQQPYEVIFRSLSDTLKLIGKKYYPVRGKKLDLVIKRIQYDKIFKATLGGCIIEKVNQTVIITKEP